MKLLVMYSNAPPSTEHLERLGRLADLTVAVAHDEQTAIAEARDADVFLGHRFLRQSLPHAKSLRWIQSTAAGIDHLVTPELLQHSPLLSRCPIFSDVVALHAFALALGVLRRIPEARDAQNRQKWAAPFDFPPLPKTAMILGMGEIGCCLGRLLVGNGLHVIGVDRKITPEGRASCCDFIADQSWRERLNNTDILFVTMSLNQSTIGMVDRSVLDLLPTHAILVNVSRGPIVVTRDLVEQLRAEKLAGAALDVLDPVPGPKDPIWSTPGLLITPKVSVFHRGRQQALERFIEEQVQRYLGGEAPLYLVDLAGAVT